uniref:Uncharacterized protein n=1 Tax=Frankliniella occidentalis associated densovirus 1 TaxID=2771466 RepID=A0A7H1D342_9VIRU|nr:hypothetical protein [Frankliniella occidentalis associated densovirus 1]
MGISCEWIHYPAASPARTSAVMSDLSAANFIDFALYYEGFADKLQEVFGERQPKILTLGHIVCISAGYFASETRDFAKRSLRLADLIDHYVAVLRFELCALWLTITTGDGKSDWAAAFPDIIDEGRQWLLAKEHPVLQSGMRVLLHPVRPEVLMLTATQEKEMKVLAEKLRMVPVLMKTYAHQYKDHLVVITGVALVQHLVRLAHKAQEVKELEDRHRLASGVLFEGLCDRLETTGFFSSDSLGLIRTNIGVWISADEEGCSSDHSAIISGGVRVILEELQRCHRNANVQSFCEYILRSLANTLRSKTAFTPLCRAPLEPHADALLKWSTDSSSKQPASSSSATARRMSDPDLNSEDLLAAMEEVDKICQATTEILPSGEAVLVLSSSESDQPSPSRSWRAASSPVPQGSAKSRSTPPRSPRSSKQAPVKRRLTKKKTEAAKAATEIQETTVPEPTVRPRSIQLSLDQMGMSAPKSDLIRIADRLIHLSCVSFGLHILSAGSCTISPSPNLGRLLASLARNCDVAWMPSSGETSRTATHSSSSVRIPTPTPSATTTQSVTTPAPSQSPPIVMSPPPVIVTTPHQQAPDPAPTTTLSTTAAIRNPVVAAPSGKSSSTARSSDDYLGKIAFPTATRKSSSSISYAIWEYPAGAPYVASLLTGPQLELTGRPVGMIDMSLYHSLDDIAEQSTLTAESDLWKHRSWRIRAPIMPEGNDDVPASLRTAVIELRKWAQERIIENPQAQHVVKAECMNPWRPGTDLYRQTRKMIKKSKKAEKKKKEETESVSSSSSDSSPPPQPRERVERHPRKRRRKDYHRR